ncbi:hypothetical protein EIM50_18270 [Pseudoxanthomonas sp. SGD-10]|nr:hypothetical protein EIM50_18270 [Pseudoxanthomonas sp. SGD-10]
MFAAIIFSDLSAWWTVLCLIAGLLYAYTLYSKIDRKGIAYLLFSLRAVLVTILGILLLAPLIQLQKDREEKPLIIVANDNSASIPLSATKDFNMQSYKTEFNRFVKELDTKYDIELLNFGSDVSISENSDFSEQQTDISQLFQYIQQQYSYRNIGAIILASDGIINKGNSGTQFASVSKTPIYTIALGDTTQRKDLLIRNVNYNRIVYRDNKYPIEISLSAYQTKGQKVTITAETQDGQRQNKTFTIDSDDWRKTETFYLDAKKVGIQKVNILVTGIEGEITLDNNKQSVFVEVLDGRQKVLLLANAPHPDINAIKQSLDANKNYETDVFLGENIPENSDDYDVIILHNLPSSNFSVKNFLTQNPGKPIFYIIGTATNIPALNQSQSVFQIQSNVQIQELLPIFNQGFSHFSISEEVVNLMRNQAPLIASTNSLNTNSEFQSLISQQKGNTNLPLLGFIANGNAKYGILLGEGIWRWRLENYKRAENFNAFDELISKTIQFLSAKEDKRRFRVYPSKSRFTEDENVILNAELYNNAYNPIEDAEISVDVRGDNNKSYSYLFSKKDKFYELNAGLLPAGEYSYIAKTNVGSEKHEYRGVFVVEKLHAEFSNITANHQLLYNLSILSGGKLFYPSELDKILDELTNNEKVTTIIYTENNYEDLIDLKWLFVILIALLSIEWFLRKRNGLL